MELRDRARETLGAVERLPQRHDELMGLQMKSPPEPKQQNQSQTPTADRGGFKAPPAQMMGEEVILSIFQSSAASDAVSPPRDSRKWSPYRRHGHRREQPRTLSQERGVRVVCSKL